MAVGVTSLVGLGKNLFGSRKDSTSKVGLSSSDPSLLAGGGESEVDVPKSADFSAFTSTASKADTEVSESVLTEIVENEVEDEYLTIYVPTCYCVVSKICNFGALRKSLIDMHSTCKSIEMTPQQIDSAIEQHLIAEQEIDESQSLLRENALQIPKLSGLYRLPVPQFSLLILIKSLSIENIIILYTAVLLERRILLRSTQRNILAAVSYTLNTLIHPFVWSHAFEPFIPLASLEEFTKAVDGHPYIGGTDLGSVASSTGNRYEKNVC